MGNVALLHDEHLTLDGNQIHIVSEDLDDWSVWLNTEVGDFDGLCIGCGETKGEAIVGAMKLLEQGVQALRQLESPSLLTEEESQLVVGAIPLRALPSGGEQ